MSAQNRLVLKTFMEGVMKQEMPKIKMFGVPLNEYMDQQKKKVSWLNVPWIVKKCCGQLLTDALDSEGLFRVPGSHQGMQELQEHFDNGQNPDLVKVPTDDVAGLLKKYLRELPEPLLSDCTPEDTLQHAFQEAMAIKDEDLHVEKLKELLAKLPRYRRALCKELFFCSIQ